MNAAARRVPRLRDRSKHLHNAIILDLESLKRLYGPTVAGAHCFQFQLIHSCQENENEGSEEDTAVQKVRGDSADVADPVSFTEAAGAVSGHETSQTLQRENDAAVV